ncbi:hypothetical protein BP6252_11520 [Coleophoma cylindrospora]|uniref:CENP-V/GFA domain-containing protein n=1 Tax=Coleophoma cylindrospora TaxID=1849047 RepID=A0A3D8QK09_9HELO|nr:hypothetical protein BP6252_11520 [Coleophoma cylindrospora]
MASVNGACNCGAVQISIPEADFPKESLLCHCLNCKASGSALASLNLVIPASSVKMEKGQPKKYLETEGASGKPLDRWFCGDCGSPCFSISSAMPEISFVKSGLFMKEFKKTGRTMPAPAKEGWWRNHEEWEKSVGRNVVE